MSKQSCRSCKHLVVPPRSDGKRIPTKHKAYICAAPVPTLEDSLFPDAITRYHAFSWPPHRTRMEVDDGANCPAYEAREGEAA